MSFSRPFAYNTGSTISGTIQVGNLAIGYPDVGFEATGLRWWEGPDEELGYVIAYQQSGGTQPTPDVETAYVQFWRTKVFTDQAFLDLTNSIVFPLRISRIYPLYQLSDLPGNSRRTISFSALVKFLLPI